MYSKEDEKFISLAIEIAEQNIEKGGGPFGAVIVESGEVVALSGNKVQIIQDPTAHAEVSAIRLACEKKQTYSLENCTIYSSCEPCPMCLGAIYWAKISRLVFAATKTDAAFGGFDDDKIYSEINKDYSERGIPTIHIEIPDSKKVFEKWLRSPNAKSY